MNILLINSPSRKGKSGMTLPLGLLYVGRIILSCGHEVKIIDPYLNDINLDDFDANDFSKLYSVVEDFKPEIVGFGGIASSYGRTKQMSIFIKRNYPEIFQIAGGALSSVYRLLLQRTNIDLVFHGETEKSLPIFLESFGRQKQFRHIPAVSYREGKEIKRNHPGEQVHDLDSIPIPAYELIDLEKYLLSFDEWLAHYGMKPIDNTYNNKINNKNNNNHYIPIVSSRGCTHKCLFCYRHVKGYRQHSVKYAIQHMNYLRKKYNIGGFQFVDELFNAHEAWVEEFCNALEKDDTGIYYLIGGARINNMNERILRRLKQSGCIEINYGHESGSDIILKELRKGVTRQQNKEITKLTASMGINCPVQLVIGTPNETTETINDTIQFLKEVETNNYSLNYLIPLPETPIWKIVEQKQIITDLENYLNLVADFGGNEPLINLTSRPDNEWRRWSTLIKGQMQLYKYRKSKKTSYLYCYLVAVLLNVLLYFVPKKTIVKCIPNNIIKIMKW